MHIEDTNKVTDCKMININTLEDNSIDFMATEMISSNLSLSVVPGCVYLMTISSLRATRTPNSILLRGVFVLWLGSWRGLSVAPASLTF